MSITIRHDAPAIGEGPSHTAVLTREAVAAIARAAAATPGYVGLSLQNDEQYGTFAYEITAAILEAAIPTLDPDAAARLLPYVAHLRRHGFTATVQTNDDLAYRGAGPSLEISAERTGEPTLSWCASSAAMVMRTLDLPFDASEGMTHDAADVAERCFAALRGDTRTGDEVKRLASLLEVARYAVEQGGHGARVVVC